MNQTKQNVQSAADAAATCATTLLCDRHPRDAVAFTVVDDGLNALDLTYGELADRSARVAAALAGLGVGRGDSVGVLMGKSADLPSVLLGIWRLGAVQVPLFTAFARPAIEMRLNAADAKVVVADADQTEKLPVTGERDWKIVQVGGRPPERPHWYDLDELLSSAGPVPDPVEVGPEGTIVLLFTSGTTGVPKGVPIPLRSLASMQDYLIDAVDVQPTDVYWNAADPGWAYGLYYGVLAPLALGRRNLLFQGAFSPATCWRVLRKFGVTSFAAAPTVYRALRANPETSDSAAVPVRLRRAAAAGEPLTPEVVTWARDALGVEVRDHYGQTELGMVIANAWRDGLREEVVAGSMGRPLPGWSCEVLSDDSDEIAPTGTVGRLAVDTHQSPSMWFAGYLDAPEKTAERFTSDGRWYVTGDTALRDEQGRFHFSARDDDVIIMAGYRIGPFDVESVLVTHEAVVEAAVVAAPDELRGEVLTAYVTLRQGVEGGPELVTELQKLVKSEFAAHAYPRQVYFVSELPKTPSGKIQRFKLRAGNATGAA
ncbi:AMP-binding protein [Amycolatopsis marina]|nr:AMP-binding protein [Amycolatopsis marina]